MEKEYKEWLKNRTFLHGLPTVEPPMWLHKCYGCGRKTIWVNYDKWGRKNITENNGSKWAEKFQVCDFCKKEN
jgi:hypothetical protein